MTTVDRATTHVVIRVPYAAIGPRTVARLTEIAAIAWQEPEFMISSHPEPRDHCYLLMASGLGIQGFFFVDLSRAPDVYMGLSGVSRVGSGGGRQLYESFLADIARLQGSAPWTLVGTTASPRVESAVRSIFARVEPTPAGLYSNSGEAAAQRLSQRLSLAAERPGVFRRATRARFRKVDIAREESAVSSLRLNESNGDRLALVAQAPEAASDYTRAWMLEGPLEEVSRTDGFAASAGRRLRWIVRNSRGEEVADAWLELPPEGAVGVSSELTVAAGAEGLCVGEILADARTRYATLAD